MNLTNDDINTLINRILDSRKYRNAGIHPETIRDLFFHELHQHSSEKSLLKAVRRKLHNIVAPYLGEPDYGLLTDRLHMIKEFTLESKQLRAFCLEVLGKHASTAERIPYLADFYQQLFSITGKPARIYDLACGLNPLAFSWMGLPLSTEYYAYDIVKPRIDFINEFFLAIGLAPFAEHRDILVDPPTITADLGLFFKEAHRFEKRNPGCNHAFWERLNVDHLAVSLPAENLSGTHSLIDQHRSLVSRNLTASSQVKEIQFADEIVFIITRSKHTSHGK
jgi:16S rRNA (guanine(1405)-N(7))-methyltransferase